jgi:hypothetical protein
VEISYKRRFIARIKIKQQRSRICSYWNFKHLRIDRNVCSVHEEMTSIRLYTPCNPHSALRKGVYNLIEVISNEPNK